MEYQISDVKISSKSKYMSDFFATILSVIFVLTFVRPEYMHLNGFIDIIYKGLRIITPILAISLFFMKRVKLTKFILTWIIFELYILFITIANQGDFFLSFYNSIAIVSIVLFFQLFKAENKLNILMKTIYVILSIFIIINFVTILLFPNGLYTTGTYDETTSNWFLGFKNKHLIYYMPATFFSIFYIYHSKYKISNIIMLLIIITSSILVKSSTGLVCITVLLLLSFIMLLNKNKRFINAYTVFIVFIIAFLLITVLGKVSMFSFIIETVLNKNLSLSNRTILWEKCWNEVVKSPLVGYGEQSNEVKNILYGSTSFVSAHSQILEYLYIGGFILLLIFIMINIQICKNLNKYLYGNKFISLSIALYFSLLISLLTEVFTDNSFYLIYFIIYYSTFWIMERRNYNENYM